MSRISEQRDVQNNLINHLLAVDWQYLPPSEIVKQRGNDETQPFLPDVLRTQLLALNPSLVTEANVNDIIRRLRLIPATLAGNEQFVQALRDQWTVYETSTERERNLTLIEYEKLEANQFHFTQELTFFYCDRRRMDMVLWVNGLPVAIIENKSPTVPEAHFEAFEQVQITYRERIPEFLKYPPLMVAANARLHYAPTWNEDSQAMNRWKVENGQQTQVEFGLERLSKSFLAPAHLLAVLRDHIIFYRADDQTHKFILRPHQMRAAHKIVGRILNKEAETGLHWHTQGSGKTLTMIVTAHILRREMAQRGDNPTLLIVVDRLDLESQMVQNLEAFGFPAVVRARSKNHLQELLSSDHRGLIVSLIHKFDRMPENRILRDSVVVLIDEAHRSQEGDLGTYMRAALPNAFYFGFTGTPIDWGRIGQGTFYNFGQPDAPHGYQDKYSMDESIEDGSTVRLYYTLAPSELRVDREALEEEFYKIIEAEGAASIDAVNAILQKADKLKAVMKAPERVAAIARHIAEHFQSNVQPLGFKAFVVAVDREGCALYKQALDQFLPTEMSRVVYTAYHKDNELMRQYHLDAEEEKRLRRAFRNPAELPQILIVTEKLLTGYDAPVLYCMYLDKPLKDHTLLQAIARVNRPYPDKESGLIVDYIGIFENLQRALSTDADNPLPQGLIDLDVLKARFEDLLHTVLKTLAEIDLTDGEERPSRIIEYFFDPEPREAFIRHYKDLQNAYEILSPDPFLRPYLDDYALITQVYQIVYNYFDPEAEKRRTEYQILKKTDALIRENVSVTGYITELPHYPINRDLAKVVKADNVSDRVKVTNLYRSILVHIETYEETSPYLISIGEEVEQVVQQLRDRQISVEEALAQLENRAEQVVNAQEEQQTSAMDGDAFALFWVIKGQQLQNAEAVTNQVYALLMAYPGWGFNARLEQVVRQELYKILRPAMPGKSAKEMVAVAENILRLARILKE